MSFILFFIISILFILEAISLSGRLAGVYCDNVYAGFSANGLFTIISRLLMFAYNPIFGILSDTDRLNIETGEVLYLTIILFLPMFLFIITYKNILNVLINFVKHISINGRILDVKLTLLFKRNKIETSKLEYKIPPMFLITYILYYLAFPITLLLVSKFNSYRATIISLPTILTGFSTLYLSLYMDPKLSKHNVYDLKLYNTYYSLAIIKLIALIISLIVFNVIYLMVNE